MDLKEVMDKLWDWFWPILLALTIVGALVLDFNACLEKERAKDIRKAKMEALQRRIDEVNRKSDELNKQLEALLKGLRR